MAMKSVRKSLRPANDFHSHALQKMSRVALPRLYWDMRRIACACMLAVFSFILCLGIFAAWHDITPAPAAQIAVPQVAVKVAPYDIRIDANSLAPPDEVAQLADALPPHVIITKHNTQSIHTDMNIVVQSERTTRHTPEQAASNLAALAHNAIDQNDLDQAIRFQRRAVDAAPDNMRYVLALAVMLDHAGDAGAAALYQQVVDAYDAQNHTAPSASKIGGIRQRLFYLNNQTMAQK